MLREKVADIKFLTEAWDRLYAGKTDDVREHSMGIDEESLAEFKKNEKINIREISAQLLNGSYSLSSLYGFTVLKKSGKFRLITAPSVRDRIVHSAILMVIQKFFPEIRNGSSYCLPRTKSRSEKVNFIDAFKMLSQHVQRGYKFVFESDIESFFDKVEKARLLNLIVTKLPDDSIDELLHTIIYFSVGNLEEFKKLSEEGRLRLPEEKIGLSQGSPLSPLFANIYLKEFDKSMIEKFNSRYIRYVDDFIVLCSTSEETKTALEVASELLKNDGLTLPPLSIETDSKTRIGIDMQSGDEFVFLGIRVTKEAIRPDFSEEELKLHIDRKCFAVKQIKLRLEAKKKKATNVAKEKAINDRIQSKFGAYGYFHTSDTMSELNKLIAAKARQSKLAVRVIQARKKGMPIVTKEEWQSYF